MTTKPDIDTQDILMVGNNALTRREAIVLRRILSLGFANYQGDGRNEIIQVANKLRRAIAQVQSRELRASLAARSQKLTREVGAAQRNKEARAWLSWAIGKKKAKPVRRRSQRG